MINRIIEVPTEALLTSNPIANKPRIPPLLKINRTLPNVKEITDKNWLLLQINRKVKNAFEERQIIAYKRNNNLKKVTVINKILSKKLIQKKKAENKHLLCSPYYARRDNLCCQQVGKTSIFKIYNTGKTYKIFHQLTCIYTSLICFNAGFLLYNIVSKVK